MNSKPRRSLEQLQIQEPCHEAWDAMGRGEGAQRFCDSCSKHVHDLSELSREQAERLVNGDGPSVCVRMTYDASGRVETRSDRSQSTRRKWLRRVTAVAAALGIGSFFQLGCKHDDTGPTMGRPGPVSGRTMGIVAAPQHPPTTAAMGTPAPTDQTIAK